MKHAHPPAAARRAKGFTLVEVLVAVSVLALALSAVISGMSRYASNAGYLRQKTVALWVAHNRLTEFALDQAWPSVGKTDGKAKMAGIEWKWRATVTQTQDDKLRRIDVDVIAPDDPKGNAVLASLTSFVTQ
ncbi:type II secretion system minor pseudopilin GspI [Hydrocarboniphaga effusa]|uniref:type II secretion system minor pseudopilin GspI n=1 Tax=Hydrocarboniphaga effusa TaxID=243629 RepID=UPI003137B4B9